MTDLIDLLVGDAERPATPAASSTWLWADVTGVAPLEIHLDCDNAPLTITPASLVAGLVVGDRVWCQMYGAGARKQLIVHGKAV